MAMKLSVVLATRNEEANIGRCLASVQTIADEIIIFDEHSTDKTREIAKKYKAHVFEVDHEDNFHITKQKALDRARGEWTLQLDADEVVSPELAKEILTVISLSDQEILKRRPINLHDWSLFLRQTKALELRDGKLGNQSGEVVAFFIPRVNMFLGKPLIHGGVYPDGVIRLLKTGKAHLPAKSVHEQMVIDGEVAWLFRPLLHYDSPTLRRYLERLNRYTDLHASDLNARHISKNAWSILLYTFFYPTKVFLNRFVVHGGVKDGMRGFLWAAFSASHYPIAYYKYFFS